MPKSVAWGLLVLRVSFGLVTAAHGLMKVLDFSNFVPKAGGLALALGAIAGELGGGLGLAVGLLTRVAGGGLAAVVFTIVATRHAQLLLEIGTGKGTAFEYPFLLGIVGIAFVIMGAGPYSLDGVLKNRSSAKH